MPVPDNNQSQPVTPPTPGQEPEGGTPAPAYITQQQLESILKKQQEEFVARVRDEYRGMQKLSDQTKQRLATLNETIKEMQDAGQAIDPAIVQRMKTDIIADSYAEPAPQPPQPPQPAATPPGQGGPATPEENPFAQRIAQLEKDFGVDLLDEDPEVKDIPHIDEVGEGAFFDAVRSALRKKIVRVSQETPERAAARSPFIGASGSPSSNPLKGKHGDELWAEAQKQIKR